MNAKVLVNGREIKESLVIVDTLNNTVSIETVHNGEKIIDKQKVYVEVNIFGDIDLTRTDVF